MRLLPGLLLLAVLLGVGCTKRNPAYCDPDTPCTDGDRCDPTSNTCAGPDGGGDPCTTFVECPAAFPVCDGTCRACVQDADCAGNGAEVCDLTDGRCVASVTAVYVDAAAPCSGGDGSQAAPFCSVNDALSAMSEGDTRRTIVVEAGSYSSFHVQGGLSVRIAGRPGAAIESGNSQSERIEVDGASTAAVVSGLRFSGASQTAGIFCHTGASCRFVGVESTQNEIGVRSDNARRLVVERSRIHMNDEGGITTVATDFVIENALIHDNGTLGSDVGAVDLGSSFSPSDPERVFRHNTVFRNLTQPGMTGGVVCSAPTILSGSIFWDNEGDDHNGSCTVEWSLLASPPAGANNVSGDPLFVDGSASPADLHLGIDSPAVDVGQSGPAPALDFDGDRRDGSPDLGADERLN